MKTEFNNTENEALNKTDVSSSVLPTETRYFLFENNSTFDTENNFTTQIKFLSEKVVKFNCGIGQFILGITAVFDDSCETENATPIDVIHNFRKSIQKIKEYKRKPSPQKYWNGEWEVVDTDFQIN